MPFFAFYKWAASQRSNSNIYVIRIVHIHPSSAVVHSVVHDRSRPGEQVMARENRSESPAENSMENLYAQQFTSINIDAEAAAFEQVSQQLSLLCHLLSCTSD